VPRFLLLVAPERCAQGESAAELGGRTARFVAWVEELRASGALCAGARLASGSGRVVRDRDGARLAAGAAGAAVASYFVVDVADWDAALALAARCPGAEPGSVDVFRLDDALAQPERGP
jgi:hypothetical protein